MYAPCASMMQQRFPDEWATYDFQSNLGIALMGQKKFAAAEPLLLQGYQGLKEREAKIPAGSKHIVQTAREQLVALYVAWEKPAQAAEWRDRMESSGKLDSR